MLVQPVLLPAEEQPSNTLAWPQEKPWRACSALAQPCPVSLKPETRNQSPVAWLQRPQSPAGMAAGSRGLGEGGDERHHKLMGPHSHILKMSLAMLAEKLRLSRRDASPVLPWGSEGPATDCREGFPLGKHHRTHTCLQPRPQPSWLPPLQVQASRVSGRMGDTPLALQPTLVGGWMGPAPSLQPSHSSLMCCQKGALLPPGRSLHAEPPTPKLHLATTTTNLPLR